MRIYKIAEEFTDTPGGRNKSDGKFSGEQFRDDILIPIIKSLVENERLCIDFDGSYGYPTSFLEEVFGGLVRKYDYKSILDKLEFKSDEEPGLIDEIREYMKYAK